MSVELSLADRCVGYETGGVDQRVEHWVRARRHAGNFSQSLEASHFIGPRSVGADRGVVKMYVLTHLAPYSSNCCISLKR